MTWIPLSLALVASVCDLRSREIPDELSVGAGLAGLLAAAVGWSGVSLGQAAVSAVVVLVIAAVAASRDGFGGGDVKLLSGLAAWLPIGGALALLFWTAIIGAVLSIVAVLRGKGDFAYGPAIAVGFGLAAFAPGWLPAIVVWLRSLLGVGGN